MTSRKDDDIDLNDLKAAMATATPRPDPAARAAHLRLAQENFDKLHGARQGTAAPDRLTSDRPRRGVISGVRNMLNALSTKGGLTVTTAIVACGFLVLTPQGKDLLNGLPGIAEAGNTRTELSDPVAAPRGTPTPVVVPEPAERLEAGARAPETTGADPTGTLREQTAITDDSSADAPIAAAEESIPEVQSERAEIAEAPVVTVDPAPMAETRTMRVAPPAAATAPEPDALDSEAIVAPGAFDGDATISDGRIAADAEIVAPGPSPVTNGIIAPAPMPQTLAAPDDVATVAPDTEAFASDAPNPVQITAETPVSTFSIDVDTASYAVVRQSLNAGSLPPRDAVRIEEMINYFPYDYPAPEAGDPAPFLPTITVMDTPWNTGTQLVHIGLQGIMPLVEDRPPLNLVFLIDTSGSMADATKLPLLRQSFVLMLDELRPEDEVAIVEYAGSAGIALAPTRASDRAAIATALMRLGAGGSTNGQGGLEQAYATAAAMTDNGETSRVILATDGDFNVGLSGIDALEAFIADKRESGIYLSVLGFGRGNLDDATMQTLAQNGNGVAAYIDTLNEAQKVLVDQLTGALFAIAGDVKVQVEFNPAIVAEYRLLGYETRALAREDFNNDAVDAGELGAGHSVTAIYEVTPVGSDAVLNDPLRYAPAAGDTGGETAPDATDAIRQGDVMPAEIGFLRLRWKAPGESESRLFETPILAGATSVPGTEAEFATAIAGFGQLLRNDGYLGDWGWDDAIALANANRGEDPFGYRTEAVQLMRLAESLSGN